MPGKFFHVDGAPTPFVRLSFASATDDDFDAGMARLASLLRALPGAPAQQPTQLPPPSALCVGSGGGDARAAAAVETPETPDRGEEGAGGKARGYATNSTDEEDAA